MAQDLKAMAQKLYGGNKTQGAVDQFGNMYLYPDADTDNLILNRYPDGTVDLLLPDGSIQRGRIENI